MSTKSSERHIYPIFDGLLNRSDKELFLRQRSKVIWFTGLSGSGKSTLAQRLEKELFNRGFFNQVLDGDNVRSGINNNLGFSDADRTENIRRIAEVSKLFLQAGIICINSFVSPTREIRDLARNIIGAEDFLEIYIHVPLEVAEQRDVKGLYKKARAGEIADFTGVSAPFEEPLNPFMDIRTDLLKPEDCIAMLLEKLLPLLQKD